MSYIIVFLHHYTDSITNNNACTIYKLLPDILRDLLYVPYISAQYNQSKSRPRPRLGTQAQGFTMDIADVLLLI